MAALPMVDPSLISCHALHWQLNSADSFARFVFDKEDVLLAVLPLYHIYGMTVLM